MSILPVANIINVTISNTPKGLTERNANSLALFSNEVPNNGDPFREYISPSQIAADWGTNSLTAKMANAIFSQSPNILSGGGRLVIFPFTATNATPGTFTTSSLTAALPAFAAVTSGDLRVTSDGTAYNITGINLTGVTDLASLASALQKRIPYAVITVAGSTLVFTRKKTGTSSAISFGSVPSGTGTDLSGASYLNASGGTAANGTAVSGDSLVNAISSAAGQTGFTGIITTAVYDDAALLTISNAVQARDNIFIYGTASQQAIAGIGTTVQQAGNKKTRILLHSESIQTAQLLAAAYAGRGFSVNFQGSLTAQTMNLKQLATISPDTLINQTLYSQAETAGVDLYVSYDGVPSVYSTGGNVFFDNIYSDLALKFALEAAGFNFLRQTNTKVPQTETGMNGLKNAYAQVMERFVRNGEIAPGSWTSSETFGDPETFRQNVLDRGYYIYSLPIVQQSSIEREQRKAPLVQIAVKRAGAIHTSIVNVLVND